MFLIDANAWINSLIRMEMAAEANSLLANVPGSVLYVTGYTVDTIGTMFTRRGHAQQWVDWLDDLELEPRITVIHLSLHELKRVVTAMRTFSLTFDDGYEYVAAEQYNLQIVSYDKGFDRTDRGRITPAAALAKYEQSRS
jgi:predicted nucleic acid-binding protein